MRAVIQRVSRADVVVGADIVGAIGQGLLVYLGAGADDTADDVGYVVQKIAGLRVFVDAEGKMSRSVADVGGAVLVVSQFTLYGDVRKGRRPSFTAAAPPERAEALYEDVVSQLRASGLEVETGRFRASMSVRCEVDGQLIDIREESERRRDGAIPGSMHLPYGQFASSCDASGPLRRLGRDARLVLYCAVGERSTLAVEIAAEHGVRNTAHIPGGFRAWRSAGGPVETIG